MSDDAIAALAKASRTAAAGAPKFDRFHARGSDYSWAAAGAPEMLTLTLTLTLTVTVTVTQSHAGNKLPTFLSDGQSRRDLPRGPSALARPATILGSRGRKSC